MSAYNAISRFSASFNPRNFVTIVTASSGSTNTTDYSPYSNFSDEDDFLTKMNTLYGTHGGSTSSPATNSNMTGAHWWVGWTDVTNQDGHWTSPLRPSNTFSQEIDSGYLFDQGLKPFVEDLLSKIQDATDGTNTNLSYNNETAYPYKEWNNNTTNVANLNIGNFNKIMVRMRVYPSQCDMHIIVWVNNTDAWGYFQQSITKSGGSWTGNMVNYSGIINRTTVPVPSQFLTNFTQYLN